MWFVITYMENKLMLIDFAHLCWFTEGCHFSSKSLWTNPYTLNRLGPMHYILVTTLNSCTLLRRNIHPMTVTQLQCASQQARPRSFHLWVLHQCKFQNTQFPSWSRYFRSWNIHKTNLSILEEISIISLYRKFKGPCGGVSLFSNTPCSTHH